MKTIIKNSLLALMMVFGLFFQSCNSDTDPSAEAVVELNMKAQTTQSTLASGRSINSGFVFTEVLLGVSELEFETLEENEREDEEGEDENEEIEYEGEFIVDLLTGTSSPDFGMADLAPGIYEEIEMEMEPFIDGQHSVFIAFNYTNANNEVINVEYTFDEEIEFEIEDENGFQLDGGVANQMLIVFNLDALFAGIDLSNATADDDGVIRINSTSNSEIAALIESNLDQTFEAGEDDDDDGEFDDDEEEDDDDDDDDDN